MSSVYSDSAFQPSMCIDGVTANPSDSEYNICLSNLNQPGPWLAVTLPSRSVVTEVVVYGRSDCCNERFLGTFQVWVGEGDPSSAARASLCGQDRASQDRASVNTLSCEGLAGTTVTLLLPGNSRTIMISELVVRGYPA